MFGVKSVKFLLLLGIVFLTASCLDLEPDSAVNFVGEPHTVTASFSEPNNVEIDEDLENQIREDPPPLIFRITEGPNMGRESIPFSGECVPDSCTPEEGGTVTWTYTSELTGTDSIVVIFSIDGEELSISDTVTKTWIPAQRPIPTLSQWGLLAAAGLLGVFAYIVLKRRVSKA